MKMTAGKHARAAFAAVNARGGVTVTELLDGNVELDVQCLDRVYLNGYVPNLQVGGQVVTFLTRHLGNPIPSPALFTRIGDRFRAAVDRYALVNEIPMLRFSKGDRKTDVVKPYLQPLARDRRPGVAVIGVAQARRQQPLGSDHGPS
jgi:hypothetical protein